MTTLEKAARQVTDDWVPVTQALLNAQHDWLYRPMWIALKSGVIAQGFYEWRQGGKPDRFITDLGDEWAFNADYVMPITKPIPPAGEGAMRYLIAPPKREWTGLSDKEVEEVSGSFTEFEGFKHGALWAEQKLKELNT